MNKKTKSKPKTEIINPISHELDPSIKESYPPLLTEEEDLVIKKFIKENPHLSNIKTEEDDKGIYGFHPKDAWIQTYSGRRFTPTNPNPDAIVIQDIAHALSMQCRFSGHVNKFYSVAQHCVLVSYICNHEDALWGLLHDATEAYLVDVPRPLKRSGKFDAYLEFEAVMQKAVCKRFGLSEIEPASVKQADAILLATEARDLMSPIRSDWDYMVEPLPFKIDPLSHQEAKNLYMKRFFELMKMTGSYDNYLYYESMK